MYRQPGSYTGSSSNSGVPYPNRLAPPSKGQQFSVAQAVSNLSSTASNLASSSSAQGSTSAPNAFRAPAHKSSHFLHSIPPREKSTRTLIIDHMLWVHGRTRFAQARAELGMTDRTGGPSSSNYVHRERPQNYEEDEERASDGEDAHVLDARESAGAKNMGSDAEDERMTSQDLVLARSLRLRAEGLEKVVTGMLDQPPPVHPHFDGDLLTPPSSPKRHNLHSPQQQNSLSPHTLPNGVRVRLTLGTIINDLFARQAPPPPYRHHHPTVPILLNGNSSDMASSRGNSPVVFKTTPGPLPQIPAIEALPDSLMPTIPPAVIPLSTISAGSLTSTQSMFIPTPEFRTPGFPPISPARSNATTPSARVRGLYTVGAESITIPSASQSAFRCPRHLFTGCEICVEAKSGGRAPRARTSSSAGWTGSSPGKAFADGNTKSNLGSGSKGSAGSGGGVTGWQDGSGIGSGLARPDMDGCVLRRSSWSAIARNESPGGTGAGNTKLSELIPRFLRLSALVAIELGSEARDEEGGVDKLPYVPPPLLSPTELAQYNAAREKMRLHVNALRPSRAWYKLLVGLLTRAALEGYLTGGWHGTDAVECLMTVGLGMDEGSTATTPIDGGNDLEGEKREHDNSEVGDEFEWFDPEEFPTLREAARIMFPSLHGQSAGIGAYHLQREGAEADYEKEIGERLKRFYAIPAMTPDLATHMEDLAWHYPAEPVERAAVRYCEAVAKWRGKPELETYKKNAPSQSSMIMTIDSLVHSNPTSPTLPTHAPPKINLPSVPSKVGRPSIEKYFEEPYPGAWNRSGGKRRRSFVEDYEGRMGKRFHV